MSERVEAKELPRGGVVNVLVQPKPQQTQTTATTRADEQERAAPTATETETETETQTQMQAQAQAPATTQRETKTTPATTTSTTSATTTTTTATIGDAVALQHVISRDGEAKDILTVQQQENAPVFVDSAVCMICFGEAGRCLRLACTHTFCVSCLGKYFDSKIEIGVSGVTHIACPTPDKCTREFKWADVMAFANDKQKQQYQSLIDADHGRETRELKLRQPPGVSIEQSTDPNDVAFMQYIRSSGSNIRQCVKCGAFVESAGGCLKMMCRCGYGFCFQCGSAYAQCGHAPGHYFLDAEEVRTNSGLYYFAGTRCGRCLDWCWFACIAGTCLERCAIRCADCCIGCAYRCQKCSCVIL